jgi:YfiR/HmsC-like
MNHRSRGPGPRRVSQFTRLLLILAVWIACILRPGVAAAADPRIELDVKAAYLLNFARYVYWPRSSGPDGSSPLVIGVVGRDAIVQVLEPTVSGRTVSGRPIRVVQFAADRIERCDILYLPRSEARRFRTLLSEVSGKPVLTVSDKENFANEGGMIEFLLMDDSVRFAINNDTVGQCGLKLSSELLRVAYSVTGGGK